MHSFTARVNLRNRNTISEEDLAKRATFVQLYLNESLFALRPFTFSFSNVLAIKEVQLLLAANFFHQMSGTICYTLDINGTTPHSKETY